MQVWRLQTKPSSGNNIDYCLKNQIAAIGWSLGELSREEREECRDFSVYLARAKEIYKGDSLKTCLSCVTALHDRIKPGDYIWMRSGRTFYLARVDEQSEWRFCPDEEATRLDSCNQLTNLRWYPYGKIESDIPGALYTAFIRGKTVQRIGKSGIETFTALLYDRLAGTHFADGRTVEQAEETFYTLLSPSDCEDLLCLWLYKTYGYVCIPSTCKMSTKLYECELINPENGGRIFVQAKNSGDVIDARAICRSAGRGVVFDHKRNGGRRRPISADAHCRTGGAVCVCPVGGRVAAAARQHQNLAGASAGRLEAVNPRPGACGGFVRTLPQAAAGTGHSAGRRKTKPPQSGRWWRLPISPPGAAEKCP